MLAESQGQLFRASFSLNSSRARPAPTPTTMRGISAARRTLYTSGACALGAGAEASGSASCTGRGGVGVASSWPLEEVAHLNLQGISELYERPHGWRLLGGEHVRKVAAPQPREVGEIGSAHV